MSTFYENMLFQQVSEFLAGDEANRDKKESGATFFKVEVLSIELITAYGTEACFFHLLCPSFFYAILTPQCELLSNCSVGILYLY